MCYIETMVMFACTPWLRILYFVNLLQPFIVVEQNDYATDWPKPVR